MPSFSDIFKMLVKYKLAKALLDFLLIIAGILFFLIVTLIIRLAS